MKTHLLILSCLGLFQSCSQGESHGYAAPERPLTAAERRELLRTEEQNDPAKYLRTQGTSRRNLIDQLVLEGTITNRATLATFKDPVLRVTWYSKTNTELDTHEYRIFERMGPRRTIEFKLKTDAPAYVATVAMGVLEATPID